jgi:hypothetical protein
VSKSATSISATKIEIVLCDILFPGISSQENKEMWAGYVVEN